MTILLLLVPISVLLLGAAVAAFAWAVRSGQFDDLDTPAVAMLADAPPLSSQPRTHASEMRGVHRLRSGGSDGEWNWSWPLSRSNAVCGEAVAPAGSERAGVGRCAGAATHAKSVARERHRDAAVSASVAANVDKG